MKGKHIISPDSTNCTIIEKEITKPIMTREGGRRVERLPGRGNGNSAEDAGQARIRRRESGIGHGWPVLTALVAGGEARTLAALDLPMAA